MYGIMNETIQESFHGAELAPDLLADILSYAEQADNRAAFADSLALERVVGLQVFSDIREDSYSLDQLLSAFSGAPSSGDKGIKEVATSLVLRAYTSPLARPWFNMDENVYGDTMGRVADAAELPYHEAQPQLLLIDQDIDDLPRTRILSRIMLPALTRACQAQGRHEATLDLMRMGLLLEQHHGQQGSYPQSLDAIAPGLGGELPVDPFTGEAYHYQPSGDSFLLYSVGGDLTDDGGAVHHPITGDIVWRGQRE